MSHPLEASIAQGRYVLETARSGLEALADADLACQPYPGAPTAGWLLGHLAVTGDFARTLCGKAPLVPAVWRRTFSPGTRPALDQADYPGMATLRAMVLDVYQDLFDSGSSAAPDQLSELNPYAAARAPFPTAGSFIAYLSGSHLAYHLGQLQAWRAAAAELRGSDAD